MAYTIYPTYTFRGLLKYDRYSIDIQFISSTPIALLKDGMPSSINMVGILKYQGESGLQCRITGPASALLGGPLQFNMNNGVLKYVYENGINVDLMGSL